MHLTALSHFHGWKPHEPKLGHVVLEPLALGVDAIAGGRCALAGALAGTLVACLARQSLVHVFIGKLSCGGDGTADAIACLAIEPCGASATIIILKLHILSSVNEGPLSNEPS